MTLQDKLIPFGNAECPHCRQIDRLFRFSRYTSDRDGMLAVQCECPSCNGRFKRIIVAE